VRSLDLVPSPRGHGMGTTGATRCHELVDAPSKPAPWRPQSRRGLSQTWVCSWLVAATVSGALVVRGSHHVRVPVSSAEELVSLTSYVIPPVLNPAIPARALEGRGRTVEWPLSTAWLLGARGPSRPVTALTAQSSGMSRSCGCCAVLARRASPIYDECWYLTTSTLLGWPLPIDGVTPVAALPGTGGYLQSA
jgi:hypothetical protein